MRMRLCIRWCLISRDVNNCHLSHIWWTTFSSLLHLFSEIIGHYRTKSWQQLLSDKKFDTKRKKYMCTIPGWLFTTSLFISHLNPKSKVSSAEMLSQKLENSPMTQVTIGPCIRDTCLNMQRALYYSNFIYIHSRYEWCYQVLQNVTNLILVADNHLIDLNTLT